MAVSPFVVERFGPLNLISDPQEVGATGAVDMLNVDLDNLGRVRTRDGYAKFTSSALAGDILSAAPFYMTSGTKQLMAWGGGTYYALNTSGAVVAGGSNSPASSTIAPMWLTSGNTVAGTYNGNAGHVLIWSGTAWLDVSLTALGAPADTWSVIGETPVDVRMVLAGGGTNPSRVTFSEPGATSWLANDFVDLWPGDGEAITGIATWRDMVFVFKPSRFAVFYGTSVDVDGNAVFNFRTIDTDIGLAARFGVAVAAEGVYFIGRDGIYLTTGDSPRKVSGAIEPLFRGNVDTNYSGSAIAQQYIGNTCMTMHRERLYVAVTTGAATVNDRLFVYDPKLDSWIVWDTAAGSLCSFRVSNDSELMFGYATGTNDVGRLSRAQTTDAGAAIAWSHKSGLYDLSGGNRVAITLESAVWGSGSASLQVANDHGSFDTGSSLTLGTAPAVAQAWQQIDREGTMWQHKLSGSGVANVNRLVHYVSFVKPAGIG